MYEKSPCDQGNPSRILHARYVDGAERIEVTPVGYEVLETGAIYTSGRALLQHLTKHPRARNWTLGRYFKLDDADTLETLPGASIMDICGVRPRPVGGTGLTVGRAGVVRLQDRGLTIAGPRKLGIDLKNRGHEVQKLLFAGFGSKIFSQGYDPGDVLQEVYKGLLARNNGICAWDETRSSFGHYVHMVCGCVLMNYHRKEQRRRSIEQIGLTVPLPNSSQWREGRYRDADVGDALPTLTTALWGEPKHDIPAWVESDLVDYLLRGVPRRKRALATLAAKLIPLARVGLSRAEMAGALGVSKAHIGKAMAYLKAEAQEWAQP